MMKTITLKGERGQIKSPLKEGVMYSPKIYEELIPELYKEAEAQGVTMTKLVNTMLIMALQAREVCYDERFSVRSIRDINN